MIFQVVYYCFPDLQEKHESALSEITKRFDDIKLTLSVSSLHPSPALYQRVDVVCNFM